MIEKEFDTISKKKDACIWCGKGIKKMTSCKEVTFDNDGEMLSGLYHEACRRLESILFDKKKRIREQEKLVKIIKGIRDSKGKTMEIKKPDGKIEKINGRNPLYYFHKINPLNTVIYEEGGE